MSLTELGWKDEFAQAFSQLDETGLRIGRVAVATRNFCQLLLEEGELQVRVPGRLRHRAASPAELPAVGDWVAYRPAKPGREGTVETVLPRQTRISRQVPGRQHKTPIEQVIAANIDRVLIMTGLDRDYNLRRLERYLALVQNGGAEPIVLLNKTDLCSETATRIEEVREVAAGFPIHAVCAREDDLTTILGPYIGPGLTLAVVGSSGVGKSTLINNLVGFTRQQTGEVSPQVGKGRHTTTCRELIVLPHGGLLIDNPGMRELQLFGEAEMLADAFTEIAALAPDCRFNNCQHQSEPGCAVVAAVQSGNLSQERYQSFLKLQGEFEMQQQRKAQTPASLEKQRWRGVSKQQKRWRRDDWREEK